MTTSSLTFKIPNTRGFNIPNNFRFVQMVDGVDMQAATLGVPLGKAIGPTELDIASVEITPGAASALFGMNTINGNVNFNNMNTSNSNDIFVTGFNTPCWNTALSYGNPQVVKHTGFNITWRWQDSFLWQSPLITGTVDAFIL